MKKYPALVLLLFTFINNSFSQTDTVYIVKTDTVFVMEKQDRMYKYFLENKEADIDHLWKLNLTNASILQFNIGYEQRIVKSLTIEGYFKAGEYIDDYNISTLGRANSVYTNHNIPSEFHSSGTVLEFEQLFKYYFNLERREKFGKKTNGFSGNYLATSFLYKRFQDPEMDYQNNLSNYIQNINLGIKYGLQRRIGRLGFIEAYAGLYYRWESIKWHSYSASTPPSDKRLWTEHESYLIPTIGIKAGFAIDSFDNLRRMIKD